MVGRRWAEGTVRWLGRSDETKVRIWAEVTWDESAVGRSDYTPTIIIRQVEHKAMFIKWPRPGRCFCSEDVGELLASQALCIVVL